VNWRSGRERLEFCSSERWCYRDHPTHDGFLVSAANDVTARDRSRDNPPCSSGVGKILVILPSFRALLPSFLFDLRGICLSSPLVPDGSCFCLFRGSDVLECTSFVWDIGRSKLSRHIIDGCRLAEMSESMPGYILNWLLAFT